MEARRITVISTKTQRKQIIMSAATTLEELKRDLEAADIDYEGMTFYEGLSKTELKDNRSLLPHDISYKGQVTNELVFMLTNPNKKIASGVLSTRRLKLYEEIKRLNLEYKCKVKYNKVYTKCSDNDLIHLIAENSTESCACEDTKVETAPEPEAELKALRRAFIYLVAILRDNDYITLTEEDELHDVLHRGSSCEPDELENSPYSRSEIDNMFDFLQ